MSRKKVNIKVRQPLQKVFIPALDADMVKNIKLAEDIIKTETNIKEVEILDAGNDFIRKKAKKIRESPLFIDLRSAKINNFCYYWQAEDNTKIPNYAHTKLL